MDSNNLLIVFSKAFMDKQYAKHLINETKKGYNLLAEKYTRTRAYIPKDLVKLVCYAQKGEKVLDFGCASGRLFDEFKNRKVEYFGIDNSEEFIRIAKENYPEGNFQTADALSLPFPGNYFDKIYSISVIHNIPSKDFQTQYLKEAYRVLRPGGILALRAWDFWRRKSFPYLFLKYALLKLAGRSKLDFKDVFVPWRDSRGGILAKRYFHCFTKGELESLAKKTGFKIVKSWRAGKDPRTNIYLIMDKPGDF